ncbi:ATP-binding protein [Streptomyces niger]|uniref:ATP-binding protein n=1 Tax=Streptomyces niger TaxID=66373 RepID=UPI00069A5CCE|nr:ATP-binding protein [Streptomyces niger]
MSVGEEANARCFRQKLSARPEALGGVRRIVRAHLRHWGYTPSVEAAVLCAHELLANVAKHTGSPLCVLTLQGDASRIRITVTDSSHELPKLGAPDWGAETGRGMVFLESMSDRWGAQLHDEGKDVWCELWATPQWETA